MEKIELKDAFAEFKNQKNIDRATMMGVLEDVFRTQITKTYGSADNFDIIVNVDKGDCEIYWNREVVEEVEDPNTQIALEDLERVFIGMGYEVVDGPEVEYDRMNFKLLNIPENHPAKDEQDTFYIARGETTEQDIVLRTQTSSVQARIMLAAGKFKETTRDFPERDLPIKIISPGRVFRSDEVDATHSPSFHQVEGLVVGKYVTMADLKGTLDQFATNFFGPKTKTKLRPHHFPFTEPSAEMDVSCFKCGGKGCRFCKGSGWIEILGCGMVHPHVLEMSNIDPEEYSGFAFGVGLERIALLKYEIADMRLLYENDIRFLRQF